MTSFAVVDKFQTTAGATYNNVVQVQTQSVTWAANGYNSVSLGSSSGWGSAPTSTTGAELMSFAFQPKFATSKLYLQTSSMNVSESSNVADAFRMSAFGGTTLLGWNQFAPGHWAWNGGYNNTMGGSRLSFVCDSWGTDSRTVSIRLDSSGSAGAYYYFNYSYGGTSWTMSPFHVTIMELQT